MATTQIQTRILNKISTWSDWESVKATFKPLRGEICIVEIPTDSSNSGLTPPATGIKVGDGNNYFGELPWIQALAGDVTAWCKENMTDYDKFKAQVAAAVADSEGELDKAIEDLAGRVSTLETNYGALNNTVSSHTTSITSLTEEKVTLPTTDGAPNYGTAGQFAVSDGNGGITWKTLYEAEEVSY